MFPRRPRTPLYTLPFVFLNAIRNTLSLSLTLNSSMKYSYSPRILVII